MLRMDVLPLPDLPISSTSREETNGERTNQWVPSGAAEQSRSERFARQRRTAAAFTLHFAHCSSLPLRPRAATRVLGISADERAAIGWSSTSPSFSFRGAASTWRRRPRKGRRAGAKERLLQRVRSIDACSVRVRVSAAKGTGGARKMKSEASLRPFVGRKRKKKCLLLSLFALVSSNADGTADAQHEMCEPAARTCPPVGCMDGSGAVCLQRSKAARRRPLPSPLTHTCSLNSVGCCLQPASLCNRASTASYCSRNNHTHNLPDRRSFGQLPPAQSAVAAAASARSDSPWLSHAIPSMQSKSQ